MANVRGLNDRQRRFAEFVVAGNPGGRAYELAGYDAKGNAAEVNASKLLRKAQVKAYLKELRKPQTAAAVLTRQRKREILAEIASGNVKGSKVADRYRAIQIDNAMTGDNQPIKVEGEITLKRILSEINTTGLDDG